MFAGWGSWVARFRWPVLSVALVAVISAGVWGLGVFGQLTEGGYNDPNSESSQATEAVQKAFGAQGGDLVVIYTPTKGKITDVELGKRIRAKLTALPKSAVKNSTSYWSTRSPQFVAQDKSSGVALVTLVGADDGAKLDAFREIDDKLAVAGTTVQLSGQVVLADATSTRSTQDLAKAEIISLPVTLILLLFLFGSLVAASLPVLVGGAAVLGSLGVLHAVAGVHEVNSFAVNVASLLGLGMAIDYGLFMVGRFREEQDAGRTPAEAVRRTVATAGRTVVFSATLLMIALGGLLLFPQGFLKSLAYGGLAAVALAALLSLTLLPALLAILGPRVDKLPIKLPGRGKEGSFWGRMAAAVLRRPVVVALPILAGLLVLAAPIAGVRFGEADERTLPAGDSARQAIETLKADYPQFTNSGVPIVLRGQADSAAFAVTLRQIPGIAQISPAQRAGEITVFNATLRASDPFSPEAREVVDRIRSLPVPNGAELLVGGATARNVDSLAATAAKLPWMVGMLVGATLLLMFFAFGSILLPIKAVLMSALSLSATFGVLVWIFQDGHGASWLDVTPAPLEAGIVVLMAAVVFGLSTDYEVFLLSRMVEARAHGATTNEAVTVGLARTGRVISAAALLLIVVTGAFALSSVTTMRFVGVGMIVALVLDATVVRMLLVPAVLGLLGNAAWWAPGPLRRLQERAGMSEHAGEETPALPSGRHAAGQDTTVLALPPGPSASAYSSWDREAAGVLLLPPAMMGRALPAGKDAATEVIPKITDESEAPADAGATAAEPASASADDDIVDAEIIEDDEPVGASEAAAASSISGSPGSPASPDEDHVVGEIVDDEPVAVADQADEAKPAADKSVAEESVAAAAAVEPDVDGPDTNSAESDSLDADSADVNSAGADSPGGDSPDVNSPSADSADVNTPSADLADADSAGADSAGAEKRAAGEPDADKRGADEPDALMAESVAPGPAGEDAVDAPGIASAAEMPDLADEDGAASEELVAAEAEVVAEPVVAAPEEPGVRAAAGPRPGAESVTVEEPVAEPVVVAESIAPAAPAAAAESIAPADPIVVTEPSAAAESPVPAEPVVVEPVVSPEPVVEPVVSAEPVVVEQPHDMSGRSEGTDISLDDVPIAGVPAGGLATEDAAVDEPGAVEAVAEAPAAAPDQLATESHQPSFGAHASGSVSHEGGFGSEAFGVVSEESIAGPDASGAGSSERNGGPDAPGAGSGAPVVAAGESVVEAVDGEVVEGETVFPSYLPEPYYPMPGVYRSESRSTAPDYSAPDDFFFAPSSAGTFASSLELPAAPESTVPYFGDRPDFESTRNLADLVLPRGFDAPNRDAATTFETTSPDTEPPAVFEAPNRQVARTFEAPDPATSGSIVLPALNPPGLVAETPAPLAEEAEAAPGLDVTRSFDAPDLDATRRLQVPGLESTRHLPAPLVERARRLENPPAPSADPAVDPLPKRPVPAAETAAEPLPRRIVPPAAETVAEPLPRRTVPPPVTQRDVSVPESLPRRLVLPPADEPLPQRSEPGGRSALSSLFAARGTSPDGPELPRRADASPSPDDRTQASPEWAAPRPEEPTPLHRPATLGDRPYSFRPGRDATPPAPPVGPSAVEPAPPVGPSAVEPAPPVAPSPAYPAAPTPPRRPADLGDHLRETRPADLGDHLRESRPADLAQYSSRTRRPTSDKPRPATSPEEPPKPARRPATLADQVPKPRRKPGDDQPGR